MPGVWPGASPPESNTGGEAPAVQCRRTRSASKVPLSVAVRTQIDIAGAAFGAVAR
jgi:hypothetical protein